VVISNEVIEEVKKRLIAVYDPLAIYLFGSYAWGCPTEDSDLDFLIVIDNSKEQRHKRGKPGYEALWGLDISKDLMVYTKEELESRLTDQHSLIYKIVNKGKILYVRA
jgi:predicted nucleotidyltransferase